MRIVIDMQGAQTESRFRGIGRYTISLTKAMIQNRGPHEIILVFSHFFPETIEQLKAEFCTVLAPENIYIWAAPGPVSFIEQRNTARIIVAEKTREAFFISLKPDIILISSLFEGFIDGAVSSILSFNKKVPTAVILYDLIPLIYSCLYLDTPDLRRWYEEKITHLKKSDLLLSISESSKREALEYLGFSSNNVVNIGTSADSQFQKINITQPQKDFVRKKYQLEKDYLMYTGGSEPRKNIAGLIRSYALLKPEIRSKHQLAIVCPVTDEQKYALQSFAISVGLNEKELVLTGYIPDGDLIALYNLCRAFVFPSWHEGFGLPALEAMNCAVPVIASNKSSLPEVIGLKEALFDPLDDKAMAKKIEEVLTDAMFRNKILAHQKKQIKKFSWEKSAKKAINSLESFLKYNQTKPIDAQAAKPKLAYISPLPPQKSGIADYSAELLPSLSKYYDIDVIIQQADITDAWINNHCAIHDVQWFKENAAIYERILYHFGNSTFHEHMFDLLSKFPGVVILHDFYLGGVLSYMGILNLELYYAHGYKPFVDKTKNNMCYFPSNKRVLDTAKGIIVHSQHAKKLADKWYGKGFADDWETIPLLKVPCIINDKITLKAELGITKDAFVVCSFGMLAPTKQNQRLLAAWLASTLSQQKNSYLIFIGETHQGEYGHNLEASIKKSRVSAQIKITGWINMQDFKKYLNIADVGVQLRTMSRGEASAAVLDCMNYGLATIVNAHGAMADIDHDAVYKLQDEFTQEELVTALEELYKDKEKRKKLGKKARDIILKNHDPDKCASKYFASIEKEYKDASDSILNKLISSICTDNTTLTNAELANISQSLAYNFPFPKNKQRLFLDISGLVQIDAKSGIERVVRSLLQELLNNPPIGYSVEPIYAIANVQGYFYAHKFMAKLVNNSNIIFNDELIDFSANDIFLGLDLQHHLVCQQETFLQRLYHQGVSVYFIIYDLLPISFSGAFFNWMKELHTKWLEVITRFNGVICISAAVAQELEGWIVDNNIKQLLPFKTCHFHLGADIENSIPSKGRPQNYKSLLSELASKSSFLMVGTIEPRKAHKQVLAAFETLWQDELDINLVIVGKQGWLCKKNCVNTYYV